MYKNFTVPIPKFKGKIFRAKKGNSTYILYQDSQKYKRDKHYSIPHRVSIGKVDNSDKEQMFPNEKYFVFFPDNNLDENSHSSHDELEISKDYYDNPNVAIEIEKRKNYDEIIQLINNRSSTDCRTIFIRRLKELKGDKSAEEFAELIGVSPKTFQNYISGKSMPSAEKLLYISDQLHCSVDYLLGKSNTKDLVYNIDIADKVLTRQALESLAKISFKKRSTYDVADIMIDPDSHIINLLLANSQSTELFDYMEKYFEATMLITPLIDEWQYLSNSIEAILSDLKGTNTKSQNIKEMREYFEKIKKHLLIDSTLPNWYISQYEHPNHNPDQFVSYVENILYRKHASLSYMFTQIGKEISSCKYSEIRNKIHKEFIEIIDDVISEKTIDTTLDNKDVSNLLNKLKSTLNALNI